MKISTAFFMLLILINATACAKITYQELRNQQTAVEGKGGLVRLLPLGIELWESGEPDHKYLIMGVINDTRDDNPIVLSSRDEVVAKEALQHNGDAVILLSDSKEFGGVNSSGVPYFKRISKYYLVKYVR